MKKIIINKQRKDGKFKVTYWYQGAENMFGGFEYPNVYNKLHSGEQIAGHSLFPGDFVENNSGVALSHFFPDLGQVIRVDTPTDKDIFEVVEGAA